MINELFCKIKKVIKSPDIDRNLLKLYKDPDGNGSLGEFTEINSNIVQLRRSIKKIINGYDVPFKLIYNKFTILKNVYGIDGIVFLSIEYFAEDDVIYESFNSIVYYFTGIKISNRMSSYFLGWLDQNDIFENACEIKKRIREA